MNFEFLYHSITPCNGWRDFSSQLVLDRPCLTTPWSDVLAASTNEAEKYSDIPNSERETTPDQDPKDPPHPPQAPHVTPAADQDDAAARLKNYERLSALARKKSKATPSVELPQPSKVSQTLNEMDPNLS